MEKISKDKKDYRASINALLHDRFVEYCESVGLSKAKALELYAKATLINNKIPFDTNFDECEFEL